MRSIAAESCQLAILHIYSGNFVLSLRPFVTGLYFIGTFLYRSRALPRHSDKGLLGNYTTGSSCAIVAFQGSDRDDYCVLGKPFSTENMLGIAVRKLRDPERHRYVFPDTSRQ
jgi:hypothetical protein